MQRIANVLVVIALSIATTTICLEAATFNGAGDDTWSSDGNWDGVAPTTGEDVTFDDDGTDDGTGAVTNTVDQNFTIGKLHYNNIYEFTADGSDVTSQNTSTNWHHTQINSDTTLTVTGNFIIGSSDRPNSADGDAVDDDKDVGDVDSYVKISGAGKLVVNNSGEVRIDPLTDWYNQGSVTTLDMSELAEADITTGNFVAGYGGTHVNIWTAAKTTITADAFGLGGWNDGPYVRLGEETILNVDSFQPCGGFTEVDNWDATIIMQSDLVSPSVTLRGKDGGSSEGNIYLGGVNRVVNWGTVSMNLNGASLDGQLNDFVVGTDVKSTYWYYGNGSAAFSFDGGTIEAQTVKVAEVVANSQYDGAGYVKGTLNVGSDATDGGTLIADSILIGVNDSFAENTAISGRDNDGRVNGTLNLRGGTIRATLIADGGGKGTEGDDIRVFNWDDGTIGNKSGTDLSITQAITLTDLAADGDDTRTFDVESGHSITVDAAIGESGVNGGIAKDGDGTLFLNGENTFTGAVTVNAGTLGGTGSVDGNVTFTSTGTHLAPGASIDTFDIDGDLTLVDGMAYDWEITSEALHDLTAMTGNLIIPDNATVTLNISLYELRKTSASGIELFTYSLLDVADFESIIWDINLIGSYWKGIPEVDTASGALVLNNVSFVPEPSTVALVGLPLMGLLLRRRRLAV
ncbi:MAG: autotransporter-associated beta strand repeat-containing protein [Candidatus Pacebacteria bacterium]|nr:autotransporter-associated beta strand repeat-containing protein [Candidatus Paceibacterota bacterium]